ncbi:hypothetical protein ETD86_27160 [Nonomuraea turkmeniaca]|uniref:DUF6571 domain-containing protein n=1 Tax=Nonomuraea turkmeniaca TaxID=103838 RepID=A0A5S4FC69_9ACTN|nr:DUF6571 family protein [Nonomuraea turkmeniaca]TMR15460.1 hypothetical protein ETD86_27160 [Nonomuraea turkmeniaca]
MGINPELMTKVIAMLKRTGPEFRESSRQVEAALSRLGVELWTSPALRRVAEQMSTRHPDLQGRLDLILATPDAARDRDGIMWADGSDWQSSTTTGAAAAKAMAAKVRAQAKSGTYDPKTIAELEKHKNDPLFAAAFAKEIPPDELKRLISRMFRTDLPPIGRPDDKDLSAEKKIADLFSTILGTASRAGKLPDKYADELLKDLGDPQSAFAIGKLLGKGRFDHAFMLDVVKRVYDYDVAHPRARAREPEFPLPGQDKIRHAPDVSPMSTVLKALIHHPKVSQDFFTDPKRRPLAYLMRERRWAPESDNLLGAALYEAATKFRDHGMPREQSSGYKAALIASWASHYWAEEKVQRNLPNTRIWAASIHANYITDVHRAYQAPASTEIGVDAAYDPDKSLAGVQPYGAVFNKDELKKVMTWAFKDNDAFMTVAAAHGQYSVEVLDETASELAAEIKAEFAAWHKSHPEATKKQIDAKRQAILEEKMGSGGGAFQFEGAVNSLSETTYAITDAANIAKIEEARKNDEQYAAFKDLAKKIIDLAPGPQGKFVGLLVDQAKDHVYGKFTSKQEDKAKIAAGNAIEDAKIMFRDATAAAMMRHGLFGDESAPTHPHASKQYPKGSAGDFLVNGEIMSKDEMTAPQRRAYVEWLYRTKATNRVFYGANSAVSRDS